MKRKPEWPKISKEHAEEIWSLVYSNGITYSLKLLKENDYIDTSAKEEARALFKNICDDYHAGIHYISEVEKMKDLYEKAIKEAEEK